MSEYDGPTLRSVRENVGVPLRRVSRLAGMSHGHLSKVERGEHGRPVTPAILAAYEKATGVRLTDAKIIGFGDGSADTSGAGWRRGRLSDARRRGFNATVAAVAIGGPIGEPTGRLLDALGRLVPPDRMTMTDVSLLEHTARLVTDLDLRCGGGLVSQLARTVLRWAVGLTGAAVTVGEHRRMYLAIGQLAQRAGWAAFDGDAHDSARSLFTVALDGAIQAQDRDLRAHVLADVAAQHNHLGYPDDALEVIAMAEGDRRVGPAVRMVLHGVSARAHAAASQPEECRQYLALAEEYHTRAVDGGAGGGWLDTVATEAHLWSTTGHAAATLARRTGDPVDWEDARRRLTRAVDAFDPATHTRARALCASRLAVLFLDAGDHEQGADWARQAFSVVAETRSARLRRHARAILAAADVHPDSPVLCALSEEANDVLGTDT